MFRDRRDAGRRLAERVVALSGTDAIVLGLARGGVPVAYEVARELAAELDVLVVRKLGVPGREELAMGAIASGGVRILDDELVRQLGVSEVDLESVAATEGEELQRRQQRYRGTRPPATLERRSVILVDDGLATGSTMRAAVQSVRLQEPRRIVVAVPVAAPEICEAFAGLVDEIVCTVTPSPLVAVGLWYEDFSATSDDEVRELLAVARHPNGEDLPATSMIGSPARPPGKGP